MTPPFAPTSASGILSEHHDRDGLVIQAAFAVAHGVVQAQALHCLREQHALPKNNKLGVVLLSGTCDE